MSHNSTAKAVRLAKEKHPERYCINRGCLYRAPCPKHCKPALSMYEAVQIVAHSAYKYLFLDDMLSAMDMYDPFIEHEPCWDRDI